MSEQLIQQLQSIVEGGAPDLAGRGYVLNLLAESCIEIKRLREALRIIAEGTLCPDLFPALDLEKDVWELQAKTAMTSAIAALERDESDEDAR